MTNTQTHIHKMLELTDKLLLIVPDDDDDVIGYVSQLRRHALLLDDTQFVAQFEQAPRIDQWHPKKSTSTTLDQHSTLPKPRPIPGRKPVSGRAGTVTCPTCKALPGAKCFRLTTRGPHGVPTDELLKNYHKRRTAKARGLS